MAVRLSARCLCCRLPGSARAQPLAGSVADPRATSRPTIALKKRTHVAQRLDRARVVADDILDGRLHFRAIRLFCRKKSPRRLRIAEYCSKRLVKLMCQRCRQLSIVATREFWRISSRRRLISATARSRSRAFPNTSAIRRSRCIVRGDHVCARATASNTMAPTTPPPIMSGIAAVDLQPTIRANSRSFAASAGASSTWESMTGSPASSLLVSHGTASTAFSASGIGTIPARAH